MQQPFRLGAWHVEPGQRRICNDRGCVRLEPKSLAVLCALVDARGEPVSRDVLVEKVWSGRVVSDDAVNRQVAKLRQALGDDPRAPRYIETIPKTGFRLLADVSAETSCASAAPPSSSRRRGLVACAIPAVIAGAAVLGLAFDTSRRAAPALEALRQLTSAPGLEIHPSPSPSGRAVVYAARGVGRSDFDLFVQDIDDGAPVRLTDATSHDLHPAWSPDGERIAYLAIENGRCSIRLVPLYRGESMPIAGCRDAHGGGGPSWSADGRALYYADRDGERPFSLRRLDVETGEAHEILAPEAGTIGDTTPRVSADGTIAFLRVRTLGVEDAYLLTPAGALRRITFDDGKIHGLAWSRGAVVVASNRRGGLFGLWRVDPAGGEPLRLGAPPGADGPGANAGGGTVAFEQWSSQVNLWSAPLDGGEPTPLVGSTRWDWWPVVAPDGRRLAWTSDRTGAAEVWVGAADGSGARRLTRFDGPYTQAAVWTPAGDALIVAAPVAGQFDLFRVDAANGDTERLTRTPEDEAAPVFAPDGRLLYRRDLPEGPVLMDLAGAVVLSNVRRAAFGPDRSLWFVRPAEPGLWRLAGDRAERVTPRLETVDWQNWWVDRDGVYLIERPHPDRPHLARLDPVTGRSTIVRELPALLYKSGLTRLGDAVVYARELRHEADLFSLEPGPADWFVAAALPEPNAR